jgi:aspartate 1-decarboxylase
MEVVAMLITICKSKIHRATITEANLNYIGSLTVDMDLVDAAGMHPYQQVSVVNINNGARLETYLIEGERGSGTICLNGAAARMGHAGDIIIIISYGMIEEKELPPNYEPIVVHVDSKNKIKKI